MFEENLSKGNVHLLITSKEKYKDVLDQVLLSLNSFGNKIGYVTINKPYNTIISQLESLNIQKDKFLFIDAITATVESPKDDPNCIFVSSPSAITDLGLAYSSLFEKKCDFVFFDTLSALAIYHNSDVVIKFVHNMVTKTRVLNKKILFFALREDSEEIIKDLNMFVDSVIEM